jgi:hypothetical protein
MDEGKKKWVAWAAAAAIFVVLMLVTPAIPQDEDYHDFADQRSLFLGTLPPLLSRPVPPPAQIPSPLRALVRIAGPRGRYWFFWPRAAAYSAVLVSQVADLVRQRVH